MNRYTHSSSDSDRRVRGALADFSLTPEITEDDEDDEEPSEEGS